MNGEYEELGLFITVPDQSYPFLNVSQAFTDDRFYARRLTNIGFTDADNSYLTYEDSGQCVVVLGRQFVPGIVVLCGRTNHQWFAIRPAMRGIAAQSVLTEPEVVEEKQREYWSTSPFRFPDVMELITTGDYKEELDGIYQLIPRHNGNGKRRSVVSHYCVGTDLVRKAGASVEMVAEPLLFDSNANYRYTMTITHPDIDTTTYISVVTPFTQMHKVSGDSTLPNDIWWRFNSAGMMPLWFDIESDDEKITGLYTLWPGYYDTDGAGSWGATSKNYIHKSDGSRAAVIYSANLFSSPTDFRIQITVPDGGALRYQCDRDDFNTENGARFTFDLESNTSSASAPDTITLRRPQTGYCKTPKELDQL